MKKILFVIVALLAFNGTALAQDFRLGPKIGLISANTNLQQNVEEVKAGNTAFGVQGGLFARVSILGFYVQPEALITATSAKVNVGEISASELYTYNYNRLDVPVLVGKKFLKFFRLEAGLVGNMLLNVDLKNADKEEIKTDLTENYQSATFGYLAGIGLDLGQLSADLRWEGSLSKYRDAITIPGTTESFNTDHRNNQLILSVGYSLF